MRVHLSLPPGISSIQPRDVESQDVFIGEPMTADGLSDILVRYTNGPQQRYTGQSYKIAKKGNLYYPCLLSISPAASRHTRRRHLSARRSKATFTARRRR
jgi:hypothetical protein